MSDESSYLFGEEEEETPEENQSFTDLRKHANSLDKKLKATTKELDDLRAFKTAYEQDQKDAQLSKTFEELGVDPKRAKYFKVDNPEAEPTKEAVAAWGLAEGFLSPDQVESTPTSTVGYTPTTVEGVAPGSKRFTRDEWLNLSVSDPEQGQRILEQGRVDLSDVRAGLGPER